jgi:hypothetical protein
VQSIRVISTNAVPHTHITSPRGGQRH